MKPFSPSVAVAKNLHGIIEISLRGVSIVSHIMMYILCV